MSLLLLMIASLPSSSSSLLHREFSITSSAAAFQHQLYHHHRRCSTAAATRRRSIINTRGNNNNDNNSVAGIHLYHPSRRRRRIDDDTSCSLFPITTATSTTSLFLTSQNDNNDDDMSNDNIEAADESNEQDLQQEMKMQQDDDDSNSNNNNKQQNNNLLQLINPFNAGQKLRSKLDSAFDLASAISATKTPLVDRLSPERRSIYYNYYVDDLMLGLSNTGGDATTSSSSSATATASSSTYLQQSTQQQLINNNDQDNRPEVLIIGATGSLGRIITKRLLLENNVRVRVLVRDLYSSTLNKLGVGVTYCQGDLHNMESLEYAVTDVDKIIFCAGNNNSGDDDDGGVGRYPTAPTVTTTADDDDEEESWDKLESILQSRRHQAELVDSIGLRNLLHAYLNVRHSDYGPSQAAKRTLFKFRKRPADFGLFGIDDGSVDGISSGNGKDDEEEQDDGVVSRSDDDYYDNHYDNADDYYEKKATPTAKAAAVVASLSQCDWTKNKFGHGVFTGKVGRYGEAALASARLRSRDDPNQGIDLSVSGFAGLVCRLCSDGGVYEAFVRTEAFERLGVEYVCEFKTASKSPSSATSENKSRDKFSTVRLEFRDFLPRIRPQFSTKEDEEDSREALSRGIIPKFVGKDIRQIGFRFRGESNPLSWSGGFTRFYLALDFIKVYRGQPEPEFIYLSDARIPPVVNDGMVKHDIKRLITNPMEDSDDVIRILDDKEVQKVTRDKTDRSSEETYFKYMGEEMIKQSGLSYTIIRVAGYNERQPGTDSSTVRLQKMNKDIVPVSRADLAQVVASAILEPNAANLVLYMTKSQTRGVKDGYLWEKFARLRDKSNTQ